MVVGEGGGGVISVSGGERRRNLARRVWSLLFFSALAFAKQTLERLQRKREEGEGWGGGGVKGGEE